MHDDLGTVIRRLHEKARLQRTAGIVLKSKHEEGKGNYLQVCVGCVPGGYSYQGGRVTSLV